MVIAVMSVSVMSVIVVISVIFVSAKVSVVVGIMSAM